ncbi:cytochrome-b5 reductase [Myriangium duriaei CBS 260.36]|uniref:Cytochrome-b5 reductase n=1 Tax=Myriangium duriaei CBS 260.36 TaxID=1168546 RepID=A0A9P4J933_9PEZI|nr:cytochrome-b5 reductase [Myriangium duriaei CBS 260.36]
MASVARRYPITAVLGTSAFGLSLAYYGYSRYQSAASQHRSYGRNGNFTISSVAEPDRLKTTFPGSGFTTLTLEESHMISHNVKMLRFKLPDGDAQSGLSPITSLLTRHTAEGAWIPTFRPYTPIDKDEPGHISFLVKRYPNGKGSGHLHSLKPGDTLSARPIHEFDYKPNQHSNLTIVAGGAGITPFVQIIRAVLSNPADRTNISLVYANSTDGDILLKSEFDELASKQPDRFKVNYVVSETSSSNDGTFYKGRITRQIIEQAMPARRDWNNTKVLICGPPPMIAAVAGAKGGFGWTQGSLGGMLREIGLDSKQVQKF